MPPFVSVNWFVTVTSCIVSLAISIWPVDDYTTASLLAVSTNFQSILTLPHGTLKPSNLIFISRIFVSIRYDFPSVPCTRDNNCDDDVDSKTDMTAFVGSTPVVGFFVHGTEVHVPSLVQ